MRMLTGQELFRLIGWSDSMWEEGSPPSSYDQGLLTSLAGNAFSGFACAPMLMLGAALAGTTREAFGIATAPPPVGVEVQSDGSCVDSSSDRGEWV